MIKMLGTPVAVPTQPLPDDIVEAVDALTKGIEVRVVNELGRLEEALQQLEQNEKRRGKMVTINELLDIRRKRAEEALASASYKISQKGEGWEVENGEGKKYTVKKNGETWHCTCEDFKKHQHLHGFRCKHTFMVEILSKDTQVLDQDPASVLVHWGKHKGKTLGELAKDAPDFIAWLSFRMEPRTEEDRKLQMAARKIYDALKEARKNGKKNGKKASGDDYIATFLAQAGLEIFRQALATAMRGEALEAFIAERMKVVVMVARALKEVGHGSQMAL